MKLISPLIALLIFAPIGLAANNIPPPSSDTAYAADETPSAILAEQVTEAAYSKNLSEVAKQKRIAKIVRTTIGGALSDMTDPGEITKMVSDLAAAAVRAAPDFRSTIEDTVRTLPALSHLPNAFTQIREAIDQAIQDSENGSSNVAFAEPARASDRSPPEFRGNTGEAVISRSR